MDHAESKSFVDAIVIDSFGHVLNCELHDSSSGSSSSYYQAFAIPAAPDDGDSDHGAFNVALRANIENGTDTSGSTSSESSSSES